MTQFVVYHQNLGVTHITNGCCRLHPVAWTIGEAAGAPAAWCLEHGITLRQVHNDPARPADFQQMSTDTLWFVLAWPA